MEYRAMLEEVSAKVIFADTTLGQKVRAILKANPAGVRVSELLKAVEALDANRSKCTSARGILCDHYPDSSLGDLVWNVCEAFRVVNNPAGKRG